MTQTPKPYSPQARTRVECALVAALSLDAAKVSSCEINPEDFADLKNREIYKVMKELSATGEAWDFVILCARLAPLFVDHLHRITNQVEFYNVALIPQYCENLRSLREGNLVSEVVSELGPAHPLDVASAIHSRVERLSTQRVSSLAGDVCADLFRKFERAAEAPEQISGVTSGLTSIDHLTWGLQPGRVYVLAGRPSMGKSTVAANLLANAARAGHRAYLQSLEESKEAVVSRIISRLSGVPNEHLQKGKIEPGQWGPIREAMDTIKSWPLIIDDSTGLTSAQILSLVRQEHQRNKVDLLVIDHIQEVREYDVQNRHLGISLAASNFRGLAKSLKIPVVMLSQLSRGVEFRANKRPMMSDLKESGDLEAIADVVMLLYRDSYYRNEKPRFDTLEVNFAKNRDGRTTTLDLGFEPATLTISDWNDTFFKTPEFPPVVPQNAFKGRSFKSGYHNRGAQDD